MTLLGILMSLDSSGPPAYSMPWFLHIAAFGLTAIATSLTLKVVHARYTPSLDYEQFAAKDVLAEPMASRYGDLIGHLNDVLRSLEAELNRRGRTVRLVQASSLFAIVCYLAALFAVRLETT